MARAPSRNRYRLALRGPVGWAHIVYSLLLTVVVFCAALECLLIFTPLWELPDTYCQTAVNPPAGDGCSVVTTRRWHWIIVVALLAIALLGLALVVRRKRHEVRRRQAAASAIAAGICLLSVALASIAAAYLLIGKNSEMCGSTLSRVDPQGLYSPDRPKICAASYAASRHAALVDGLLAVVSFAGSAVVGLQCEQTESLKQ